MIDFLKAEWAKYGDGIIHTLELVILMYVAGWIVCDIIGRPYTLGGKVGAIVAMGVRYLMSHPQIVAAVWAWITRKGDGRE